MAITQDQMNNLIQNVGQLSKWEKEFVDSVSAQFAKSGKLSVNQERVILSCLEKVSPAKLKEKDEWEKSYDDEKRKIAKMCAEYYRHEGYFATLADDILDKEDFIPTKEQYEKMCGNKYALRVIENSKTEHIFNVGDLVQLRSGVARRQITPTGNLFMSNRDFSQFMQQIMIVIEHDKSRPRTAKRIRCAVLSNSDVQFWCDEKHFKSYKVKK